MPQSYSASRLVHSSYCADGIQEPSLWNICKVWLKPKLLGGELHRSLYLRRYIKIRPDPSPTQDKLASMIVCKAVRKAHATQAGSVQLAGGPA